MPGHRFILPGIGIFGKAKAMHQQFSLWIIEHSLCSEFSYGIGTMPIRQALIMLMFYFSRAVCLRCVKERAGRALRGNHDFVFSIQSVTTGARSAFMQRLAALVTRPTFNLIRFQGVLAPNAKFCAEIIPCGQKNKSKPSGASDDVLPSATFVRISSSGCSISNTVHIVMGS
jgi:hypothetical protein